MKEDKKYLFRDIESCNMCGSSAALHKIIGKRLNRSQGKNPCKKTGITTTVVRCTVCGLVFSNPQPIPFDLMEHYGIPPESYWVNEYFKVDQNYFKNEIIQLKKMIDFKVGMKALDIGAGLGKCMIVLSEAGFKSYGFEPSLPFYERAIEKMGIGTERLKFSSMEDAVYPSNTFDFITFGAVLEHLYNPSDSIVKAIQWLNPGGIIHIEVPSSNWLINSIANLFYRLTFTDYVANISPMHIPFHLYEFNIKSFSEHAKKHNYEIANHEYYVCDTYLPKFMDFFLKPYMKWTNTGMQLCVWIKKK